MSSQKGNVVRSRPQKHQNTFSFKNDKFDKSVQTKKINAKLHDGVCQHCKEVLEWRVKYSKYKPLSKPKKCSGGRKSKIKVLAGHAPSAGYKGGIFLASASFWFSTRMLSKKSSGLPCEPLGFFSMNKIS
ncbi:uncharacterized protein C9orf85 homolog isoform X3 [Saimiri boliviensis]|uniref:uncharacterized protein C9orf85 homolog isoform X3 n=1 Tax=Saimiri boliviensis TaxID=27679 RepID=UPI003D78B1E7